MILTVDVGNSRIKAAVFENNSTIADYVFYNNELATTIQKILNDHQKITQIIVASVGNNQKQTFLNFEKNIKVTFISHENLFPFNNKYETPLTLGVDRMVLAAGAVLSYPNQNRLVIDAGTCITYDFVDHQNNYLGGAIAPGLRLRYEALHNYTAKLPLLSLTSCENFIGMSTDKAIHSGVVYGCVYEIDGFIDAYKSQYSNFIIILTGGDADFLAKRLKNTIFANSNFLLESLNHLYQYSIKND